MDGDRIRILIVDDHAIVREGLCALIGTRPDMQVVGEARDGHEAVELTRTLGPDLILMDLVMPKLDGVGAIKQIIAENREISILVLTSFVEDEQVFAALEAGARGYLLKDSSPDELLQGIEAVYQGQASLHPIVARKLLRQIRQPAEKKNEFSPLPLTERETEVLRYVTRGLSDQQIAEILCLSKWTVRTHVRNILAKLELENRTQAALFAVEAKLFPAHEE